MCPTFNWIRGRKRTKDNYAILCVYLTRREPINLDLRMVSTLILSFLASVDLHCRCGDVFNVTFHIKNTSVLHEYKKLLKEYIKQLFSLLGNNTFWLTNNCFIRQTSQHSCMLKGALNIHVLIPRGSVEEGILRSGDNCIFGQLTTASSGSYTVPPIKLEEV